MKDLFIFIVMFFVVYSIGYYIGARRERKYIKREISESRYDWSK